jgi:formiminoglutamate deiminase
VSTLFCELAWLGGDGVAEGLAIDVEGDTIVSVTPGLAVAPDGSELRPGLTLPGLANAHSHAFQRALRGRTQGELGGSFWTWREQMYALAEGLDPDNYLPLARAAFAEMALAGITVVGEFHYVHHGPGGTPYADPNAMGAAVVQAAAEAGVRLTLIDACYLQGGLDRFRDADADAWAARVDALGESPTVRVGAAIHSVRAVDPHGAATVAAWARERGRPLHAHVSEQPGENLETKASYGVTPTRLLDDAGALGAAFTAVHATHLTDDDIARLGGARATIALCPTTERDLADGVGPARRLADAGAALAVGSDSHAVVDLFEEARAIELDERLATGVRGHHHAAALLSAATVGGYASLGWPAGGRLAPGAPADLITVGLTSPRLAGTRPADAVAAAVYAAAPADVTHVTVAGRAVVRDGRHQTIDVGRALAEAVSGR